MHLHDLNPPILEIPKQEQWHRVQRIKPISGSIRSNGFVLAPLGLLSNRFDLVSQSTAYLADSPETALYESVFRREARSCSLENLSSRAHLVFETMQRMRFADLRGHEEPFPVLQSMRYEATQLLAQDCVQNGLTAFFMHQPNTHTTAACVFSRVE